MERVLVVVDEKNRSLDVLEEFAALTAAVDAELVILGLLPEANFDERSKVLEEVERSERTEISRDKVAVAKQVTEDTIEKRFETPPRGKIVGRVPGDGEGASTILEVAESENIDHIALAGRRRSPTGKAIFGDVAQGVILNFDGYVTVKMQ